jgi:hypothetical protein
MSIAELTDTKLNQANGRNQKMSHFHAKCGRTRKMAHRGGQFIATTHHPETIRKFSDENTFVLVRKTHMDPTLPRLMTEIPYSGDLINALIRDEIIG